MLASKNIYSKTLVGGFAALLCLSLLSGNQIFAQQKSKQKSQRKARALGQSSLYETKGDIKAFTKRFNQASTDVERTDAVVDLCYLYLRVVGDSRFSRSETLQGNRGQIAAKLQAARNDIQKLKRKAATEARKQERQANKSSSRSRHSTSSESTDEMADRQAHRNIESAIIDKQWLMLSHITGGTAPSMYYGSGMHGTSGHFYRGRFGGLTGDNGDELLNLVRTIIHPDFWQVNGGPGRAYYYQPLRILVVRATQRVHEDMHSLLLRLRGQL